MQLLNTVLIAWIIAAVAVWFVSAVLVTIDCWRAAGGPFGLLRAFFKLPVLSVLAIVADPPAL
jgi:hypothetical protein